MTHCSMSMLVVIPAKTFGIVRVPAHERPEMTRLPLTFLRDGWAVSV